MKSMAKMYIKFYWNDIVVQVSTLNCHFNILCEMHARELSYISKERDYPSNFRLLFLDRYNFGVCFIQIFILWFSFVLRAA